MTNENKHGSRRTVFIFKNRVVKIPRLKSWVSFIRGINENLEERYWYSADGSRKSDPNKPWDRNLPLAEIFWADRFGFFVVMERVDTICSTEQQLPQSVQRDLDSIKKWATGRSFLMT